jgi:hypothetical protein
MQKRPRGVKVGAVDRTAAEPFSALAASSPRYRHATHTTDPREDVDDQ